MKSENGDDFWSDPVTRLHLQTGLLVNAKTTIADCVQAMQRKSRGCLLVVDDEEHLVGIFTEGDVMVKFIGTELSRDEPVSTAMTPTAIFLPPTATVSAAIDCFAEHQIRHIPIIDDQRKIRGLLSVRVLADYIAEHMPADVLNLPPREDVVSTTVEGG